MRQPLPGSAVHNMLRAKPIGQLLPRFEHKLPPKLGSVLILLFEENGILKFPLIKRPTYTGAHSGQISLPGGKVEKDEDVFAAALRETEEEIGVNRNDIEIIGKLSEFNVLPSNFLVTPVVAFTDGVPTFIPDKHEVERVIQADLLDFLREDAIRESEILAAGLYRMMAPHFLIEDEIVWGATAMMLNEFRSICRDSK
ncbi:MAG TPA: CoA pyrophosphatase [Cyclobacteriaceae bacterium]|nr:CoA pyrophosphatase [Cyclobacteriaceae bacterium]